MGPFSALVSKCRNSKSAGRKAKWDEIWETGIILFVCIWGSFDLLVFKVILGLFGALVPKRAWYIAGTSIPEFENNKSMYEIFHYSTSSGI